MEYLPLFVRLQDQDVLLVGGGAVAARKARLLLSAGAHIRIVAENLGRELLASWRSGEVQWAAKEYHPDQIVGARLVYAATDDRDLNRQVSQDAEIAGVLVNVVDDPAHCRFISPAIVDRSPLVIAISTGGAAPVLARRLREKLERILPAGFRHLARLSGEFRQRVTRLPSWRRRRFWERVLSEQNLDHWAALPPESLQKSVEHSLTAELESESLRSDAQNAPGVVHLVGAGPGDPGLLTLRALQLLQSADVIVHDRLVGSGVLDLARRDADRIDVGKRAGLPSAKQEQINQLLLEQARQGRNVVRLKGGDPGVFGRGGEEHEFLTERGIECHLVPGITAASACAAAAGVSLTHRAYSQALTLVTGHALKNEPDLAALAGEGRTLAIYMGLRQAARIRASLVRGGVSAALPALLVINGTLPDQRMIHGSVGELEKMVSKAGTADPGLLLIGQVAGSAVILRDESVSQQSQQPAARAA